MYPSSVLESLEYLTLLLGIPAERLVRDGIIPGRPGHQLQPGKQREGQKRERKLSDGRLRDTEQKFLKRNSRVKAMPPKGHLCSFS